MKIYLPICTYLYAFNFYLYIYIYIHIVLLFSICSNRFTYINVYIQKWPCILVLDVVEMYGRPINICV